MSDNANDEPDEQDVPGTPDSASGSEFESDSGSASDVSPDQPQTTDSHGMPVDNPSGG
ncbi:hypothetical protein [Microbacterium sp. BR1]|jgi:hypothetical protein|uniref:hypothetical protein n=1 Tax=Microbacterium sp. BR1 TaxID=1070896 RepID=UPI0012FE0FB4|nr:hypothetical protein [Microbacterium sp. BR1]